ncbi:nuclear transport factor 2 family protein [Pseudoalteromonas fenneropenaei]|uniref:Nuclear transport factor 2 family protein n=1 Tax=Pseudoalteromonas fenneropenaei TaxID=1737459 RepID=A0ABV7CMQ1_9GAMM
MSERVERFVTLYNQLNRENLATLAQIYSDSIEFRDPLHRIVGLNALHEYFSAMYENTQSVQFTLNDSTDAGDKAFIYWQMRFSHKRLRRGQPIVVEGHSQLYFAGDKVCYHRDYFDVGSMLYEHLPLLGCVVRKLKARVAQ